MVTTYSFPAINMIDRYAWRIHPVRIAAHGSGDTLAVLLQATAHTSFRAAALDLPLEIRYGKGLFRSYLFIVAQTPSRTLARQLLLPELIGKTFHAR